MEAAAALAAHLAVRLAAAARALLLLDAGESSLSLSRLLRLGGVDRSSTFREGVPLGVLLPEPSGGVEAMPSVPSNEEMGDLSFSFRFSFLSL